ncbi:membrane bound O-acyl transferase family-domain-containing protein [Tricladium varicosporioides]|nr:membrane bound O-acyl transferase family-domain-containing protein [Hymenoscyphus varicosporioides]
MSEWNTFKCLRVFFITSIAFTIGFFALTRPVQYPKLTLLLIALPTLTVTYLSNDFTPYYYFNSVGTRFSLIWLAHMSYILCILPVENFYGTSREIGAGKGRRWRYASKMMFNGRWLGTYLATEKCHTVNYKEYRDGAQHIVTMETTKQGISSRPGYAQEIKGASTSSNRRRAINFIAKRAMAFLIRYIAICFYADPTLSWFLPPGSKPWSHEDYAPSKRAFLSRILLPKLFTSAPNNLQPLSSRDVLIRLYLGLDQIIPDYLLLSALHDLCAIFFVATGIDGPDEWPPFFGNITDAFTIRNYWGRFWHHLIYRSYSAHAARFSSGILRIKTGISTSRYINNTLTFLLSGLSHVVADIVMPGPKCGKWLVLVWTLGAFCNGIIKENCWVLLGLWISVMDFCSNNLSSSVVYETD